eukprot:GAHX01000673.1.p1 GENE.GAHX01000673.1~~GAHX01000673.1.p1  ORF type:complete len:491 (+),score=101.63 GAHX01000673.1:3433-4905(+)
MIPHLDAEIRQAIEHFINDESPPSVKVNSPEKGYLIQYQKLTKSDYVACVDSLLRGQKKECTDCGHGCHKYFCMDCTEPKCEKYLVTHIPFYTLKPFLICNYCTAVSIFSINRNLLFNKFNDSYTRFFFCIEDVNKLLNFHYKLAIAIIGAETSSCFYNDATLERVRNRMKNCRREDVLSPFMRCCYELNELLVTHSAIKERAIVNSSNIWKSLIKEPYKAYLGFIHKHTAEEKDKTIKLCNEERSMYNKLIQQHNKVLMMWEPFDNVMETVRCKIYGRMLYDYDSYRYFYNEQYENCKGKFINMENFDEDSIVERYIDIQDKATFKKHANKILDEFKKYYELEEEYNKFVSMGGIEHDLVNLEGKSYLGVHFDQFDSFNYKILFSCREAEQCYLKTTELIFDFYELFYQVENKKNNIEADLYHKFLKTIGKVEEDSREYSIFDDDAVCLKAELNVNLEDLGLGDVEKITEDIKINNFEAIHQRLNNLYM